MVQTVKASLDILKKKIEHLQSSDKKNKTISIFTLKLICFMAVINLVCFFFYLTTKVTLSPV